MESLHEHLRQLVRETCCHRHGSLARQRGLTTIIRLVTPRLWRDASPYYQDALQKTWIYFCQNLCEGITGRPYDPDAASVVTWLNAYLKRRLQDGFIAVQQQQRLTVSADQPVREGDANLTVGNLIPAQPDVPPILEQVRQWAETDATQELQQVRLERNPQVTCQLLILRRLPPETPWKALADEFGVPIGTLSSFYQRHCLPRLRQFGQSEGFL